MRQVAEEISAHRIEARKQAILLVENTCDEYLQQRLRESAACEAPHTLVAAMVQRLEVLYRSAIEEEDARESFDAITGKVIDAAPAPIQGGQLNEKSDGSDVDWGNCLEVYREMLQKLRKRFGLPTELKSYDITI